MIKFKHTPKRIDYFKGKFTIPILWFYVYEIIDKIDGSIYVGKGKGKRIYDHYSVLSGKSKAYIDTLFYKHARENKRNISDFECKIIAFFNTEEEALSIEKKRIKQHIFSGINSLNNCHIAKSFKAYLSYEKKYGANFLRNIS